MTRGINKPEFVNLWAGWRVTLAVCTIDRELSGRFLAWADGWSMEIDIVEFGGELPNGEPLTKEALAKSSPGESPIEGKGWIGCKDKDRDHANGVVTTRVSASLYADASIAVCTVSYVGEKYEAVANFLIGSMECGPNAGTKKYSLPDECARLLLDKRRRFIQQLLKHGELTSDYQTAAGKLDALRLVLSTKRIAVDQASETMALGTVFGDAFVANPDFQWVVVNEDKDTKTAVRHKTTALLINAHEILAKRLERGEAIDVHAIYKAIQTKVLEKTRTMPPG